MDVVLVPYKHTTNTTWSVILLPRTFFNYKYSFMFKQTVIYIVYYVYLWPINFRWDVPLFILTLYSVVYQVYF